jgi:hypothetical protein
MDARVELLQSLSAALTRGQGAFTERDLALAFGEVYGMLIQSQLLGLVIDEKLNVSIRDGVVFYAAVNGEQVAEPMPLETLIGRMRSTEDH